jgi:hypothetical protein
MVPGQHRAGEIVEAARAGLAAIALPVRLGIVAAVPHHGAAAAAGAAHALRPAVLAHQGEALGVVDQGREVDQVRCGHGGKRSFDGGELPSCSYHSSTFPAQPASLTLSTPDPDKSLGGFAKGAAAGLQLRHDHGSQYVSHDFQAELRFLGIQSSPAFVREPEGNGCAERFVRVLKENLLWVRRFDTVEELRLALLAFQRSYNQGWIIERHGYRTPAQVRAEQIGPALMAA